jgi:hypothetical protein
VRLSTRDQFRVQIFYRIVDCLIVEYRKKRRVCSANRGLFCFLTEFESFACEDAHLVISYTEDIESFFVDDFVQLKNILVADTDKNYCSHE